MESSFQFTNPVLTRLDFCSNAGFESSGNTEVQIQTKMSVSVSRDEEKDEASVELTVEIGEKSDAVPYWIVATEKANFKWADVSDSMRDRLLNQNAPSLLLAYLRPILAQITNSSQYGIYNIPFMNFTK